MGLIRKGFTQRSVTRTISSALRGGELACGGFLLNVVDSSTYFNERESLPVGLGGSTLMKTYEINIGRSPCGVSL